MRSSNLVLVFMIGLLLALVIMSFGIERSNANYTSQEDSSAQKAVKENLYSAAKIVKANCLESGVASQKRCPLKTIKRSLTKEGF